MGYSEENKYFFLGKTKNSESTKEHPLEADYLENTTGIDESNLTAEQQLGLKQAEERLERDYISRLEKVGYLSDKKENGCCLSLLSPYFCLGAVSTR